MASMSSGTTVVVADPVSITKRPRAVRRGPVTYAETMMSSWSVTKGVSSFIIKHQGWADGTTSEDLPREIVADDLVGVPEGVGLFEWVASCLSVSDDTCGTELPARMNVVDLDHAYPLVRIEPADRLPRQRLRDRWCRMFGCSHDYIFGDRAILSSSCR